MRIMCAGIAAAALSAALAQSAAADPNGFYKGKTLTINVAGGAGGGVDIGARLVSRYLGRHLPGEPQIIVQLMPGSGGVRAMEYLAGIAPKDGTMITAFPPGTMLDPVIGPRKAAYGVSDFTAVGALEKDNTFCTTWFASPVKTLEDARRATVLVGGTGAGSGTDTEPLILNEVLGTRFKVVTGYLGTQETALALERGEVDGRCGFGFASLKASRPEWLAQGKLNFLVQMGLERSPDAPGVPMALDLADTPEKKAMIRLMAAPAALSRPYLAPPRLPPERAGELRAAFMATLADPEFRAEFAKSSGGSEPNPTQGAAMQTMLEDMQTAPPAVVARLRALLNP